MALKLGKIFDIDINLHYTWFFIMLLLAWSLASEFFPAKYAGFSEIEYWVLGVVAAVLLFLSVLFHELSHSLVAKHHGMKVQGITLFFFGGVASASEKNLTPRKEFEIAIAGPLFSVAFGGICFLLTLIPMTKYLFPVLDYLFQINVILAMFNMIPGFPLDGGRVLRSILWKITGNLKRATYWASLGGRLFGILLTFYGFYLIFNNRGGLWYILLGGFLYVLAKASYEQVVLKENLSGKKLAQVTVKKFASVKPDDSLETLIDDFRKGPFIVKEKGKFFVLNFDKLRKIPRHEWPLKLVKDIMVEIKPLREKDSAYSALVKMHDQEANLLPVVKNGKVTGVVILDSLLRHLS